MTAAPQPDIEGTAPIVTLGDGIAGLLALDPHYGEILTVTRR